MALDTFRGEEDTGGVREEDAPLSTQGLLRQALERLGARALAVTVLAVAALIVPGAAGAAHTSFPSGSPFTGGTDLFTGFAGCPAGGGLTAGPSGVLDDGGSFFVVDFCNWTTYRFPPSGGDASTALAASTNGLTHALALQDGHYYGVSVGQAVGDPLPAGVYEFDPSTLAVTRTVITTGSEFPQQVVADPLSGDLYVTLFSGGILRIQNPASASPTTTQFVSTTQGFDGAAFAPDGSVLYVAASGGYVLGYDRTGALAFSVATGHPADGIAVASANVFATINGQQVDVSNNIFANSNDGTIEMIDVHNNDSVSVVAEGGSRGDFATVGPDHCLYVTQSNTVEKMTPCFFEPTPDPSITASGTAAAATEGHSFNGTVATFSDPDTLSTTSEYTATINWGDGSASDTATVVSGSSGSFTVRGTHTYAEEGSYTVTTTISDADNSRNTATATSTATVADAGLSASGTSFNSTNPVNHVVASFSDADPGGTLADYTASIDWGDGSPTSTGTIATAAGGGFTVSGIHAYAALGPHTVKTHVCDTDGTCSNATSQVIVFAYASTGGFVVGDNTVGPIASAVGESVYFWGGQWSSKNSLSGGAAPSSFKGFEDDPGQPSCGVAWSGPRSAAPPATVPSYMAVIVSSAVNVSAKNFTGSDVHVVVVKTAGYNPQQGTPGTGTIASVIC